MVPVLVLNHHSRIVMMLNVMLALGSLMFGKSTEKKTNISSKMYLFKIKVLQLLISDPPCEK